MVAGQQVDRRVLLGLVEEIVEHLAHFIMGDLLQAGHFQADSLDILGGQVLEYFRRAVLVQAEQQDCTASGAAHLNHFSSSSH
ncbi:hypothetical protein D3C72_2179440 [compost metagenome]